MKIAINVRMFPYLLVLFLPVVFFASTAFTLGSSGARESHYSVFSHGFKVGEVRTVCAPLARETKKTFRYESDTRIDADFLFIDYHLDRKEEATVGVEGTSSYQRTTRENGIVTRVDGRYENGCFRFTVEEGGVRRQLAIPKEKYDFTTLDCPELTMGPEARELTLRILDLGKLVIVKRKYRWIKDEDIDVDGKRYHCKVIDFEDPDRQGRRWVEGDDLGILVARQEGKGPDGSYSSRLTKMAVKQVSDHL